MAFRPRKWQIECVKRFLEKRAEGATSFVLEACMGAGKSALAAWIAKVLLEGGVGEEYGFGDDGLTESVDHVLVLMPWRSIQGDAEKGMLGAFGQLMGLDSRDRFFTYKRQARQPRPDGMDATITLYQEVCNQAAIETLKMWKADGWTFALICDEIHHTNEIDSSWGDYVEEIKNLAAFSVFMSGTFYRSDRNPISCIPTVLNEQNERMPVKDYRYTYPQGVKESVVRPVTTREINATVLLKDRNTEREYSVMLDETSAKELSEAKKQVLDPHGECVRHIIELAHTDLLKTRSKYPDAACLFVCRPGGGENFTREDGGGQAQEDRHVHAIAKQIEGLTGERPTVVTHRDADAAGKIAVFRRGNNPYLVAVNMVSEGCDIPRIRAVAFCRYTTSEMLFRQIVGRALRRQDGDDDTAAQIYLPSFPQLLAFGKTLYLEAQEGIRDRTCAICEQYPCRCPCEQCGQPRPCECKRTLFPQENPIVALNATPVLDGGHFGADKVMEEMVRLADRIKELYEVHRASNSVQMGHAFQAMKRLEQESAPSAAPPTPGYNPIAERDKLRRVINRHVRRLGIHVYKKDFKRAYYQEIERFFREKFTVIVNTWSVEQLRPVADRLDKRILEVFRRG
ncbi:MAG TPA: DEAD/DEAH box helicase family protein [Gemmataceae bacterium]|nr:DEAD/DEAH box helicase family protein [Gemmataceae bacterium]